MRILSYLLVPVLLCGTVKGASTLDEIEVETITDKAISWVKHKVPAQFESKDSRPVRGRTRDVELIWMEGAKLDLPSKPAKKEAKKPLELKSGVLLLDARLKSGALWTIQTPHGRGEFNTAAVRIKVSAEVTELCLLDGALSWKAAEKQVELKAPSLLRVGRAVVEEKKPEAEEVRKWLMWLRPHGEQPLEIPMSKVPALQLKPTPSGIRWFGPEVEAVMAGAYKLEKFSISKNEISNADWRRFEQWSKKSGCFIFDHPDQPSDWKHEQLKEESEAYAPLYGDDHPVVGIAWWDAYAFCRWAGGRLPREIEWLAAGYTDRSGEWRVVPWGNKEEKEKELSKRANFQDLQFVAWKMKNNVDWLPFDASVDVEDGFPLSAPLGSFKSGDSQHGVQEMAGNVSEWIDAKGRDGRRAARGGNFGYPKKDIRSDGARLELGAEEKLPHVGIRLLIED